MIIYKNISIYDPLFIDYLKFRYKVYCEERGFENSDDHPYKIEFDEYDLFSKHIVAINEKEVVGCCRLIQNSPIGFPTENNFVLDENIDYDRNFICEISRFSVSKTLKDVNSMIDDFIKKIFLESKFDGQKYFLLNMTRGLKLLLKRKGINFIPIGRPQEFHGLRTPHFGVVDEVAKEFFKKVY
jgi:N-acyl-L-homoserine lactone synthetase